MVERRSLGTAMDMTPEKMAFIKGESKPDVPIAKAVEKTIDIEVTPKEVEPAKEAVQRTARRSNRRSSLDTPGASEVLDQVLVPVTIRLPRRTAQALKRAYLEQQLKDAKPDTQQEIVEEAVAAWPLKQGFWE